MEVFITMVFIITSMEASTGGIFTVRTTAPGILLTTMAEIIHHIIVIKTALLTEGGKNQVLCQQDGVAAVLHL